jgi:hypothetical protein
VIIFGNIVIEKCMRINSENRRGFPKNKIVKMEQQEGKIVIIMVMD